MEEYTWIIAAIRENPRQMSIDALIDKAFNDMPEGFEIRPFLMVNRVGVKKMLLTEYNEAETMALFKEEGLEEGWKKGSDFTNRSIAKAMKEKHYPLDDISEITGLSLSEIAAL